MCQISVEKPNASTDREAPNRQEQRTGFLPYLSLILDHAIIAENCVTANMLSTMPT